MVVPLNCWLKAIVFCPIYRIPDMVVSLVLTEFLTDEQAEKTKTIPYTAIDTDLKCMFEIEW